MTQTFIAQDIECDGCANSIKNALGKQPGVISVSVSVTSKTITIEYDENLTTSKTLADELSEIGFTPQA